MNIDHLPTPLFIAHRGFRSRFPENTLSAFKGAMDAGAHMIELDVTLTKDRELVVIHDDTVDRTTDGCGTVSKLTLRQLVQLDAGSWFDPRFNKERLPTLAQVLETTKNHIMVNIEIKHSAFEPNSPIDAVERQVLDIVMKYEMMETVLVSSFHWPVLKNLRKQSSDIALGLLSNAPANKNLIAWFQRINGFSWHPDYRILSRRQVNALHEMGARVFPYTVNCKMNARKMLSIGVDGLIVDNPDQMTTDAKVTEKGDQ